MCCCLGEEGCGRGDGQTPCSPAELKVEEGWCVHASGCFQHCVGCFTEKCWQKVPGDLCRRHREGWRERRDAGRGTLVWAGEQELLPKQGLRHCTHTPGQGNSSLPYHHVLHRACKKAYMKTRGAVPIFSSCCMRARNRLLVIFWLPVHVNEIQWKQLLSKGRTRERCKGLGDCKKWMASLPCYPARTTAQCRWDSTKYSHWLGIT